MQVYVQAKSKAELNRRLAQGETFEALHYGIPHNDVYDLERLPVGTVVKIFEKYVGGNPYAKAYGTVANKGGKVIIK